MISSATIQTLILGFGLTNPNIYQTYDLLNSVNGMVLPQDFHVSGQQPNMQEEF